ncbi:MAG: hypothetical protein ABGY75_15215 [Gemmataceae bacterium]
MSKPPKYLAERHVAYDPSVAQPGDLMRVTYYLHSSGKGLCRQERPWVTADGVWNSTDPDRGTEEDDLIAPEVANVTFEFASGSGYVSDWDGSQAGTDGSTNQGPPRAVKMTLTFEYPPERAGGDPIRKTVVHVFPVRASVGPGASTTTTTIQDLDCNVDSVVILSPMSATAAAAFGAGLVWATPSAGMITITHNSTADIESP